jgi:hypothetical protein
VHKPLNKKFVAQTRADGRIAEKRNKGEKQKEEGLA